MNVKIAITPIKNRNSIFYTFDKLQNLNLFLHRGLSFINNKIFKNNHKLSNLIISDNNGVEYQVIACKYENELFNENFDYDGDKCLKLGDIIVLYDTKIKKRYSFINSTDCDKFLNRYRGYFTKICKKHYEFYVTDINYKHTYRILEYKMFNKPSRSSKKQEIEQKKVIAFNSEEIRKKKKERRKEITRLLAIIDEKFGGINNASDKNAPEFKKLQELERTADWKDE